MSLAPGPQLPVYTPMRPLLFYAVADGTGRLARAELLIAELSYRYEVRVFADEPARRKLGRRVPNVAALPRTFGERFLLWLRLAAVERPAAVICDGEPTIERLARLAGAKRIAFEDDPVWEESSRDGISPWMSRVHISNFYGPRREGDAPGVRCVHRVVSPEILAARLYRRGDGPIVVHQRYVDIELLHAAALYGHAFVVHGDDRAESRGDDLAVQAGDRNDLARDLARAPFVITDDEDVTISALVLGKAVLLSSRIPGVRDRMPLEALGVGRVADGVTVADISRFAIHAPLMGKRAAALRLVDHEGLVAALEEAIRA